MDVGIIGGGFAGLYTLKHCLEEGLTALLLEKQSNLGGVWNQANGPGSVQSFTYAVTSKLYLSPSDFPPPADWPEFPHCSLVYEHLMAYAAHFHLLPHVRTQQEVVNVVHGTPTHHTVYTQNMVVRCRHLVVATGANRCPYVPQDALFARFSGPTMHIHDYSDATLRLCANKRVLIVGGSDHASDVAGQICRVSAKTYVSIRDGQWFQDRMLGATSPADMLYNRMVNWGIKNVVGKHFVHRAFGDSSIRLFWGRGGSDIDIWNPKCDYLVRAVT